MASLKYTPPHTCALFMRSEAFGRIIMGPVGSGKTTSCIMELLRRAIQQEPGEDGLRHTRFAIVRQTLSQLTKTVLKDIQMWLSGLCEWKVSDSTVYVSFGSVRSEWIFVPLEEPKDQQRLLSSQLTGAWISEAIEIDVDLVAPISGRCGRFPTGRYGVATWSGMIADTNFPTEGSPWYQYMESPPASWVIFKQPGGRSTLAENLPWLNQTAETLKLPLNHPQRLARGRAYYDRLAENRNLDWVKRYVDALYGSDPSGSAVYKTSFKRSFHVMAELEPVPGRMIIVGQDFGRNPWSLITQLDHKGRLLVLEEVEGTETGLEQHIRTGLRPALMQPRYLGRPVAVVGDPSGHNKSSIYETNEFEVLRNNGFAAAEAPTNDLEPRLRAVEFCLLKQVDGGPMLCIDESRCPMLVAGMNGLYKFAKAKTGVTKNYPDKNAWSHVNDALQYACLIASDMGAYAQVFGRVMNIKRTFNRVSSKAWA